MTRHDAPLQRRAAARARSKCGGSAWPGGRALRLQRRAAPTRTAHAAVARKRCPARSCMMMSETPPPPRPRQEREARVAPSVSSSAKRTTSSTSPPSPGDNVRNRGSTCGRSGVQRLRLWCRARSARPRPGCRIGAQAPGAARHLGAERVARGGDGSQRLRRPAQARRRAAPWRHAAPSAERVARGGDQARRRRRARSAHATGAERVARGDASWHAGAARASSRSSNAGRLLPASATLTSFVGGIKTMSPAPGRRPPITPHSQPRALRHTTVLSNFMSLYIPPLCLSVCEATVRSSERSVAARRA